MMQIRAAIDRGHSNYGWLDSHHTFSFADYHDPKHVHVSQLRVLNDDTVAPGAGFPPHPHRDMEIISYVLAGSLLHEDSLGHRHTLHAGEIQRMTAGSGIVHSEYNASDSEPVHFLQIWIFPNQKGLKPDYEIMPVAKASDAQLDTKLDTGQVFSKLVVPLTSGNSSEPEQAGALHIHQDVTIYGARPEAGSSLKHQLDPDRTAYLHLASGALLVNGQSLVSGDALILKKEAVINLEATEKSDVLLFDLP